LPFPRLPEAAVARAAGAPPPGSTAKKSQPET
jgi:hypothetical protein